MPSTALDHELSIGDPYYNDLSNSYGQQQARAKYCLRYLEGTSISFFEATLIHRLEICLCPGS